jgi:hypothetical protein
MGLSDSALDMYELIFKTEAAVPWFASIVDASWSFLIKSW